MPLFFETRASSWEIYGLPGRGWAGNWLVVTDGPRQGFATGNSSMLFRHWDQAWLVRATDIHRRMGVFEGLLQDTVGLAEGDLPRQCETKVRALAGRGIQWQLLRQGRDLYGPRGRIRKSVYKRLGSNYLIRTGGLKPVLIG